MAKSFLPTIFEHPYEIDPKYGKSVAYFSMEYAIDNSFKIYSGGLGYLSGSHMRSAHDLRQNLVGVGILWSYGYYNQIRAEDGSMATQYMRKNYPFLEDHNIKFLIHVCGAPVWVKAYFLNPETFGTAPMFFLSTDLEENDEESRNISRRLYDANGFTRIAQYVLLGKGGARLFDELGIEPEIYHLNEAHGLAAAFHVLAKTGSVEEVRKRFVFTTHTPEEAGNEKMDVNTMNTFSFFDGLSMEQVRAANFPHVNMDLIAGLPEDTPEGFARSLDEVISMGADNITVHTLSLKKGSRIMLEGSRIPGADEVAQMLDYADPTLRKHGFEPYYLYRQKYMSGSFENVGWCISGAEGLYNIYIMEELHSILSLGAGGSTKMVDAKRNRIERVFHPKFPLEYIQRPEKLTENLEAFRRFHQEMAR